IVVTQGRLPAVMRVLPPGSMANWSGTLAAAVCDPVMLVANAVPDPVGYQNDLVAVGLVGCANDTPTGPAAIFGALPDEGPTYFHVAPTPPGRPDILVVC